ncbi:gamma-glutamyl-gamma-aminobutyrate hydrolase [Zhengella mangrovi]|uniref:gamma-glutamyl-gamma-aminobutyrate hydrolase n=1 Tax=Zhengella mangrovi TaxID=1982044 RepID=A0A2G1QLP8_9HYPH|nr:gamma-glutamyl-gamma-aminobutyrate hydrolase family protein [Zhengella mangrovi]PHP66422.1 gamma-glutamyl-gamma-aminobutyrate hydrolase [Zhengella mangrovi]
MAQPLVAVTSDIREFDNYIWHCVPETYLSAALQVAGVLPLGVPAFGSAIDAPALLARMDGLLVTGSRTNVHPGHYGVEASDRHEPFDPARDETSIRLIRAAIAGGVPLLAICRGIQELNVALGGSLETEIQDQEGIDDHRAPASDHNDDRFAVRHPVQVKPGSCLAAVVGAGEIQVNSLHRQAIGRLAPGLDVDAVAPDGTVEAVSVTGASAFAIGVQWHPEYWAKSDTPSAAIFKAFGAAAAERSRQRQSADASAISRPAGTTAS